jgi:hypothetical protein
MITALPLNLFRNNLNLTYLFVLLLARFLKLSSIDRNPIASYPADLLPVNYKGTFEFVFPLFLYFIHEDASKKALPAMVVVFIVDDTHVLAHFCRSRCGSRSLCIGEDLFIGVGAGACMSLCIVIISISQATAFRILHLTTAIALATRASEASTVTKVDCASIMIFHSCAVCQPGSASALQCFANGNSVVGCGPGSNLTMIPCFFSERVATMCGFSERFCLTFSSIFGNPNLQLGEGSLDRFSELVSLLDD